MFFMLNQFRQGMTAFAGVVVVSIICLLAPGEHFVAQGVLLPAKKTLSPVSPDSVRVVNNVVYPYQVLGIINVEKQFSPQRQQLDVKAILTKARQLAATVGANAVVLGRDGFLGHAQPGTLPSNQIHWVFKGLAIKVDASLIPMAPGIEIPVR